MRLNLIEERGVAQHIDLSGPDPRVQWSTAGSRPAESKRPVADPDLIIPVRNEEHRLPATLAEIGPHLRRQPWTTRLVIVDNGSVDATAEVVDQARSLDVDVDVIGCRTQGKGAAVRTGMAYSSARWVGYCDADMSTPLETIDEAVHQLQRGFQVVIASRRCTGARYVIDQPLPRRVASRAFHALTGSLVGTVSDTQCGLKFFEGRVGRVLFAECQTTGFAFDVEVVGRAHRAGLRMIELPVDWSHSGGSTLQMSRESLRVAREVWSVHRTLRTVGAER